MIWAAARVRGCRRLPFPRCWRGARRHFWVTICSEYCWPTSDTSSTSPLPALIGGKWTELQNLSWGSCAHCTHLAFHSSYTAKAFGPCFSQLLGVLLAGFSAARFRLSTAVGLPLCCCTGWGSRRSEGFLAWLSQSVEYRFRKAILLCLRQALQLSVNRSLLLVGAAGFGCGWSVDNVCQC